MRYVSTIFEVTPQRVGGHSLLGQSAKNGGRFPPAFDARGFVKARAAERLQVLTVSAMVRPRARHRATQGLSDEPGDICA